MRILIAAQPKTGNVWLRNILSSLYDLEDLNESLKDVPSDAPAFVDFVKKGLFKDDSIFHEHLFYKEALLQAAQSTQCDLVTLLRNPYDTFVSFFFYVNNFSSRFLKTPPRVLIGKRIEHPDVIEFLQGPSYRRHLLISQSWLRSGKSHIVRYEDLLDNPLETVQDLSDKISPTSEKEVLASVEKNTAERMRAKSKWMAKHIRSAQAGGWKKHLKPIHLEVFREYYGDIIKELGYPVA